VRVHGTSTASLLTGPPTIGSMQSSRGAGPRGWLSNGPGEADGGWRAGICLGAQAPQLTSVALDAPSGLLLVTHVLECSGSPEDERTLRSISAQDCSSRYSPNTWCREYSGNVLSRVAMARAAAPGMTVTPKRRSLIPPHPAVRSRSQRYRRFERVSLSPPLLACSGRTSMRVELTPILDSGHGAFNAACPFDTGVSLARFGIGAGVGVRPPLASSCVHA